MSEPQNTTILGELLRHEIAEIVRQVMREEVAGKDDCLMDVDGVAAYLKQSPDWVYRHWRQIGGRKIGAKSIRFYKTDVDRWLKSRK